jgi:uncharacterized membrane-anchored protein
MIDSTAVAPSEGVLPGSWQQRVSGLLDRYSLTLVLLGMVLQFGILTWTCASPLMTVFRGNTVRLRVVPVDPRDLFRGEYVILGYEISQLPQDANLGVPNPGDIVFVELGRSHDSPEWKAVHWSRHRPTNGIFLRGTVQSYSRVEYGIESYFVEEGQGPEYERAARSGDLYADIVVDEEGRGIVRQLIVE